MKRSKAIKIYKNHPDVKRVLKLISGENNWVYQLFDLIYKKVTYRCRTSKLPENFNLYIMRDGLTITIFGILLLRIAKTKKSEYLYDYKPVKKIKSPRNKSKESGKGEIIGKVPLDPSDWRPLKKQKANQSVDEYLSILNIFSSYFNKEQARNIPLLTSLVNELRDNKAAPTNISTKKKVEKVLTQTGIFDFQLADSINSTMRNKSKAGRKHNFSETEFLEKIKGIPDKSCISESELAKKIGMPRSTFIDYVKRYNVDLTNILK